VAANKIASRSQFLINGEPTDNRLALATRGVYRVRLRTQGRAAHSGYPELGESAIDKLLDVLHALRRMRWPADDLLGVTHYTVGLIKGGVAPNV
ncbi:peptidase dimerization protein, partial [Klebsiella pneumoniae]|uniref:peptidase dimerization domain-containing protein n=1 Tax=Klebsiella pneumoniae TaxID=573 RepID=UPI00210CB927